MIRYKPAMHQQLAALVIGKAKDLSKALGYREAIEETAQVQRPLRRAR